jgi:hypothetical protein
MCLQGQIFPSNLLQVLPMHLFQAQILVILFRLFDFLAPKDFKVIWASNLLTIGIPDKVTRVIPEMCHLHYK